MIKFSIRNLLKRRTRSLLTLSGIIIGVAMIISLVSISEGLTKLATEFVGNFNGIFVLQKDVPDDIFSRVSLDDLESIGRMTGVKEVSGQISNIARAIEGSSTSGGPLGGFFIGTGPNDEDLLEATYNAKIDKGRFLTEGDKYKVVIGEGAADTYNKQVGDKITFSDIDWRIVGIFESGAGIMDDGFVVPIEVAQEISGFDDDIVTFLTVLPEDSSEIDELVKRIDLRYPHLDAYTAQELGDQAGDYLETIRTAFWLISIVAGIVGGIGVANTMITSVYERTKEIGILRAVGWTQRNIISLILTEGIALSVIGGVLGIFLGSMVAEAIAIYTGFSVYVSAELTAQAFTFALIVGVVGGLYPAVKAAQMDPVMALRFE